MCRRLSPLRASWRGRRTSPASTTTRTPSTVRLDSAMSVGEHDAPPARRRRGQGQVLLRRRQGCRAAGGRRRRRAGRASRSATRRMAGAPGRKTSTSPSIGPDRLVDGGHHRVERTIPRAAEAASARRRGTSGPGCPRRRTSPPARRPVARRRAWPTWPAAAGRGGARPGRRAPAPGRGRWCRWRSWTSSNTTRPVPGRLGSACRRRVRMPSVTTSTRVPAPTRRSSRVR